MNIVLVACGSFSPVTLMHLRMMECARERVLESFPNAQVIGLMSPVNDAYGKKGLASAKHRIEMCRLSTLDSNWICVHTWEANEPKNQETIKVLDHIAARFPHARILLVCGSDLLQSFNSPGVWADEDVRRILDYGIVVISRPGTDIENIVNTNHIMKEQRNKILVFNNPQINNLSSTYVRTLIKDKKSIKYLVCEKVENFIKENHLFIE
jgi:nicotinamide mononucleotide adenylyltransferase